MAGESLSVTVWTRPGTKTHKKREREKKNEKMEKKVWRERLERTGVIDFSF